MMRILCALTGSFGIFISALTAVAFVLVGMTPMIDRLAQVAVCLLMLTVGLAIPAAAEEGQERMKGEDEG